MSNIAVVPARRGSVGLYDKNMRPLGGKPLVQWSIDVAKACEFDKIVVTSDDPRVLKLASESGVIPLERPESLAGDDGLEQACWQAVRRNVEAVDAVCILLPSSPFRTPEDVVNTRNMLRQGIQSVVTVNIRHDAHLTRIRKDKRCFYHAGPYYNDNWRRLPKVADINEAVFWVDGDYFLEKKKFIGPRVSVFPTPRGTGLQIRDFWDWLVAEAWAAELKRRDGA